MTAFIRPSLILRMDLDNRLYSDEVVSDIKRTYSYVAPSTVQSHEPADEARVENVLRFRVIMHRAYWDKNDAAAQELWEGVMPKWLNNMFYKVSNTITASNKIHNERGEATSDYAWLELEFGENALVAIKTQSDSSFPDAAEDMVEQVRDLYAAGTLGEGVACVRIPSRASYEAQLAAAEEAAAAAEEAAVTDEAAGDAGGVAATTNAGDTENASDAEATGDTADADAANDTDPADSNQESAEETFVAPKLPAFDIDYSLWGIEYSDGTVQEFNAAEGTFQE